MKRWSSFISLLLCLALMMPCAMAQTHAASAQGFGGEVTVNLDIENDTLVKVEIAGAQETPAIGGIAIEKMAEAMVAANSVDVDGVAGATLTSNAISEAAAAALTASGATLVPAEAAQGASAEALEPEDTDVLVIGGGGAGIAAGSAAVEAGARVILVEKLPFLGGCTAMSGGVFTRAAMDGDEEGSMDSEALYDFLMETAEYKVDEQMVHTYIDNSIPTFEWVYDNMVGSTETAGRYAMVPETIVSIRLPGDGGELMGYMTDYAYEVGVDIRLETTATELIMEDGVVVGAVVQLANGSTQEIYANGGVVMAAGGFASSPEMLASYSTPGADRIASYASAGTVGDPLTMGEKVGAAIRFNDDWDTCGSFSLAFTGYDTRQMHYMALLNSKCERFIDEANIQPAIYTAMRHEIAKDNMNFWFLTDNNIEADTQWLVDNAGAFQVDTVEDLAAKMNISVDALQETLNTYNETAGTENDSFGKPAEYNMGLTPPYTVVAADPMRTTTIGGLVINTEAEVLDADGNAIPGLYAAGEAANGSFYYVIYTCGTAVGHAIIFGRIAGENAAQNALA